MYVCMYVCIYVLPYVCLCVCVYVYVYMYVYISISQGSCMYIRFDILLPLISYLCVYFFFDEKWCMTTYMLIHELRNYYRGTKDNFWMVSEKQQPFW